MLLTDFDLFGYPPIFRGGHWLGNREKTPKKEFGRRNGH